MSTPTTKTELLKSHEHELVKTYQAFDGSGRLEYVYTAAVHVADGGTCLATRYAYDGITSRVIYLKEYYATWDSDWEEF